MAHSHASATSASSRNQKSLTIVFCLTTVYLIVEIVGGILTGSLALIADTGHMLTDVAGVGLALLAIRFAARPATPERTFGYYRVEILAALTNSVVLILISLYILYEAVQRFRNPPVVESGLMLGVAAVGLLVNIIGVFVLRTGSSESLNMKGAYFEVLSDALTSIGVIAAGAIMLFANGLYWIDPLISAGIGLFILPRTWALLKEAVNILLEGTPADVNIAELREGLSKVEGVAGVHDLHVWCLTSGVNAMSVHVIPTPGEKSEDVLERTRNLIFANFKISHTTIQVEPANHKEESHF